MYTVRLCQTCFVPSMHLDFRWRSTWTSSRCCNQANHTSRDLGSLHVALPPLRSRLGIWRFLPLRSKSCVCLNFYIPQLKSQPCMRRSVPQGGLYKETSFHVSPTPTVLNQVRSCQHFIRQNRDQAQTVYSGTSTRLVCNHYLTIRCYSLRRLQLSLVLATT